MAVLLSEVGRNGRLDLIFSSVRGRTVIRQAYCEVPFKITRLHDSSSNGIAHLILMQCTAGLFGGDSVECTIHVETGARVRITQQSATKVHPSGGRPALQRTCIRVERAAELHIYNDPVIPFSGSRMHQTTSIDVETGARLCYWEGLMAGRIGRGEVWQFEEFASETRIRLDDRVLFMDRFHLLPGQHPPTKKWTMGDARYLGTGLCFDQRSPDLASRLHAVLPDAGVDTPVPGLVAVRVVASEGPDFHRYRQAFEKLCAPA